MERLWPLRRPRDRARDQARLRQPARPNGAGGRVERPRRPTRLRGRLDDEPPLQGTPRRADTAARRAFSFLTPFFFLKCGLNVSLGAVFANLGLLAVLLAAKMLPKLAFVDPLARRAAPRHATFSTLLMNTGLTFATISALFGLNAGIIDGIQFSLLVTVVVLSAVIPTAVAERWFLPDAERERHDERRHAPFPAEEYV
jgi:Sodium/hydrogen exchanger family